MNTLVEGVASKKAAGGKEEANRPGFIKETRKSCIKKNSFKKIRG